MVKKLIIAVEDKAHSFSSELITVQYNPNRITINKSGGWSKEEKTASNTPSYKKSSSTLDIELFFDTTQINEKAEVTSSYKQLFDVDNYGFEQADVRNDVNKVFNLANPRADLNNRPPICRLIWGGKNRAAGTLTGYSGTVMFQGLLENATKTFTRFSAEGIPTRATLSCKFKEYEDPEQGIKKLNPIDDPTRIVKQGETLSSIAREEYGNAALWRVIADANRLTNPRQLEVGSLLTVPPLPRGQEG